MKSELKSLAFAFKARDIELYLDPEQNDCIFINRLVCSNCNWYFHTSLLECYFCSEKNYFDTNTTDHQHFFDEDTSELIDCGEDEIDSINIKKNITGKKIKSVEVLIRVESDNQNQN